MKAILVGLALLAPGVAAASEVGCPTTVSLKLAQRLAEEKSNEVVNNVFEVQQSSFSELMVFVAVSSSPRGFEGIPYATTWAVIARKGPQATCTVESIVKDAIAQ